MQKQTLSNDFVGDQLISANGKYGEKDNFNSKNTKNVDCVNGSWANHKHPLQKILSGFEYFFLLLSNEFRLLKAH